MSANLAALLSYFKVKQLGEIAWVHRANTADLFQKALNDPKTHFFEGDIRLKNQTPVMAHDKVEDENHFLLRDWIEQLVKAGKGMKLDFKDPRAVEPALNLLKKFSFPSFLLILNADVLPGPKASASKFQPQEFIRTCRAFFPKAMLSLGFTATSRLSGYNPVKIEEMLKLTLSCQPATVALRVNLVSDKVTKGFLKHNIPLTFWGGPNAPLGKEWWQEHHERIFKYTSGAFMDFPRKASKSGGFMIK